MNIGDKVIAILFEDEDTKTIFLIGEGIYVGDEIPDEHGSAFARYAREKGMVNPKITLDEGGHVWGGECWWGPKDQLQAGIDDRLAKGWKIEKVNMAAERAAFEAQHSDEDDDDGFSIP